MSFAADRHDEVLAIYQERIPEAPPLVAGEPFAAQTPAEVGVPPAKTVNARTGAPTSAGAWAAKGSSATRGGAAGVCF